MNLNTLQTTLREFAAEREWQPFHTPKNLAMALMVEAAELAEIFQWMTPEQSQAASSDRVVQEQIANEVADVLLYLLQIADHTGIDLKRATDRKLAKNAEKHPPLRPGLPAGAAVAAGIETHVLVDWENVQPRDSDVRLLVPDVTDVWLFHGPNQKGVAAHHESFGDKATPVKISRAGKNALDFHLSFYMGYIAARHPDARFVVVSNDKGYAPMLEHAAELGFSARQTGFGNQSVAATKPASNKGTPANKVAAPAKKGPAKKTAAKKAAAKKAPAKKIAAGNSAATPAKAAAKKVSTKTSPTATKNAAGKETAPFDLSKAVKHVAASLNKTTGKPARQAKLLSTIKSLIGPAANEQDVNSVLAHLLASGKVQVNSNGAVRYEF